MPRSSAANPGPNGTTSMRQVLPDFWLSESMAKQPGRQRAHQQASPSWQYPDFDAIEARYAVGLGPERDLAGARDGPVGSGEQFFAIKRDREPWTFRP